MRRLVSIGLLAVLTNVGFAYDAIWQGGTGHWNDSSRWSTMPTSNHDVYIDGTSSLSSWVICYGTASASEVYLLDYSKIVQRTGSVDFLELHIGGVGEGDDDASIYFMQDDSVSMSVFDLDIGTSSGKGEFRHSTGNLGISNKGLNSVGSLNIGHGFDPNDSDKYIMSGDGSSDPDVSAVLTVSCYSGDNAKLDLGSQGLGVMEMYDYSHVTSQDDYIININYDSVLTMNDNSQIDSFAYLDIRSGGVIAYDNAAITGTNVSCGKYAGDSGYIDLFDTSNFGGYSLSELIIGQAGTGVLTIDDSASVRSSSLILGSSSTGNGCVVQENVDTGVPCSAIFNSVKIGDASGSVGDYTLSDNSSLQVGTMHVGVSGSGSLSLSAIDGSCTIDTLKIASGENGQGLVEQEDIDLTLNYVSIAEGSGSSGEYTLTNSNIITDDLAVGQAGEGVLDLGDNTTITVNPYVVVVGAESGSDGHIIQNSGTNSAIYRSLILGEDAGSTGRYTVGSDTYVSGDSSTLALSAGDSEYLYVGQHGTGEMTVNDAGNVSAKNIYLGRSSGGDGLVNQNGGEVSAEGLNIGYASSSVGEYNIEGGILSVESITVGQDGSGELELSGNTSLDLSGEQLLLKVAQDSGSSGAVIQHDNSSVIVKSLNLGYDGDSAAYSLDGNSTLSVSGDYYYSDLNLCDHSSGEASLAINDNSAVSVTNNLFVAKNSDSTADISINSTGSADENGQALSAKKMYVGYGFDALGTINHQYGDVVIDENVYLAYYSNSVAAYNLSGGSLQTQTLRIGYSGDAVLDMTGGTVDCGYYTYISSNNGNGDLLLSGTSLFETENMSIGASTLEVDGDIQISDNAVLNVEDYITIYPCNGSYLQTGSSVVSCGKDMKITYENSDTSDFAASIVGTGPTEMPVLTVDDELQIGTEFHQGSYSEVACDDLDVGVQYYDEVGKYILDANASLEAADNITLSGNTRCDAEFEWNGGSIETEAFNMYANSILSINFQNPDSSLSYEDLKNGQWFANSSPTSSNVVYFNVDSTLKLSSGLAMRSGDISSLGDDWHLSHNLYLHDADFSVQQDVDFGDAFGLLEIREDCKLTIASGTLEAQSIEVADDELTSGLGYIYFESDSSDVPCGHIIVHEDFIVTSRGDVEAELVESGSSDNDGAFEICIDIDNSTANSGSYSCQTTSTHMDCNDMLLVCKYSNESQQGTVNPVEVEICGDPTHLSTAFTTAEEKGDFVIDHFVVGVDTTDPDACGINAILVNDYDNNNGGAGGDVNNNGNEAMYVRKLDILPGGCITISHNTINALFYLRTGDETTDTFRQFFPGDTDLDGDVDLDDFIIMKQNYGITGPTWTQGDFNGDRNVDLDDYIILQQNYGRTTP